MNRWTILSILTLLASSSYYYYHHYYHFSKRAMTVAKFVKNPHPFPAFFFSHGGPTFMYEDDPFGNKGAWRTIKKLGAEIKTKWKPDYIIVVSAHWQSVKPKLIEINKVKGKGKGKDNQENELIYDFFGFPSHMYKEEFHTRNDEFIADEIKQKLQANGFDSQVVERGVDHGVWVPLKVAFSDYNTQNTRTQPKDKQLDLECPMIQVSLTSNDHDFKSHYKLGEVLNFFRDNKIWDERQQKYLAGMVICSGMSVHNLRDLGAAMRRPDGLMPYVKPFNKILTDILEKREGGDTLKELTNLQLQPIFRQAHPTFEHFLPVVVASGIANDSKDNIKELYNAETASLGWGIYQVGEAPKASL